MTSYAPLFDVLAGGRWVLRGAVWRWEPDPEPPADEPSYRPHDLIACPTCLARMDEHCRRPSGRGASHAGRLVKRVCACGGPIRVHEPVCGFCRAEAAIREAGVA